MFKASLAFWIAVTLVMACCLGFGPMAGAQMQDHDPCGNVDHDEPELTCGESCGFEWKETNGQPVLKLICEKQPISTPGYTTCDITTDENGSPTCTVSFVTKYCTVA